MGPGGRDAQLPRYWAGDTEFLSTVTAEAVTIAKQAGDMLTVAGSRAIPMLEFTSVGQLRQTLAMVQAAADPWFEALSGKRTSD